MKKLQLSAFSLLATAFAAAAIFLAAGCEDDENMTGKDGYFGSNQYSSQSRRDGSTAIELSPGSATATTVGEKITFRVKGGRPPYRWQVSNPSAGKIGTYSQGTQEADSTSGSNTEYAYYTVRAVADNSVMVIDANNDKETSYVYSGGSSLSIDPATIDVTASETVQFTITGGTPPYSATLSHPSIASGTLSGNTYTMTTVNYNPAGTNEIPITISVMDNNGKRDSATATYWDTVP
jgi:hypothetical protein